MTKITPITTAEQRFAVKCYNIMNKLSETHINADACAGDPFFVLAEQRMYKYQGDTLPKNFLYAKRANAAIKYYRSKYGKEGVTEVVKRLIKSTPFLRMRLAQKLLFAEEEETYRLCGELAEQVIEKENESIARKGTKFIQMIPHREPKN